MMVTAPGTSTVDTLKVSGHVPAGGRSNENAADTMAGGLQPTRKKLPQLIPDGLTPEMHLQAGLRVQNPLSYEPATTASVKYALRNAPDDLEGLVERRVEVSKTIRLLVGACADENAELLRLCEPSVAIVLQAFGTTNVALMREIAFVCDTNDIASPGLLLIGLPMLGWAPGADGLMPRLKPPTRPVKDFLQSREERNENP